MREMAGPRHTGDLYGNGDKVSVRLALMQLLSNLTLQTDCQRWLNLIR